MRFRVMDNKTGKEADPYEIALHEEWAQGLVYCDMEGFMLTENGDLMLADECGTYIYCDPKRFKVVFEDERPHGEWKNGVCTNCGAECFEDDYMRDIKTEFCHRCGADMREKKDDLAEIIEAAQSMKDRSEANG